MNLTQRQMQGFLAVAQLRHFTRAAEQLHMTQAGLSAMMKDLEAQLGCRLLDRTTRSVSLTEEGRQLLPVATRLVSELQGVRDALHHVRSRARSLLTVGVTPTIAASVMPAVVQTFARQHPDVTLTVRDIGRQAIQEGVAAGTLDVGFGAFFRPASGLERRPIAMFGLLLVGATGRAARLTRRPQRRRWVDIDNEPLLTLPQGNPIQTLIDEQLRHAGLSSLPRLAFDNIQTLLAMAEAGVGQAILPAFVGVAAQRHALCAQLLVEPEVPVSYFQITRKGTLTAPAATDLALILRSALRGEVGWIEDATTSAAAHKATARRGT